MERLLKLRVKHGKFAQIESETCEVCAFYRCACFILPKKYTVAQVVRKSSKSSKSLQENKNGCPNINFFLAKPSNKIVQLYKFGKFAQIESEN